MKYEPVRRMKNEELAEKKKSLDYLINRNNPYDFKDRKYFLVQWSRWIAYRELIIDEMLARGMEVKFE